MASASHVKIAVLAMALGLLLGTSLSAAAKPAAAGKKKRASTEKVRGSPEQTNAYLGRLLDSYEWGQTGIEREGSHKLDSQGPSNRFMDQVNSQVALRESIRDFAAAEKAVSSDRGSDAIAIATSAEAASTAFGGLVKLGKARLALLDDINSDKPPREGVVVQRLAAIQDATNESWRILLTASVAATHALAISKTDTEPPRLNLYEADRAALVARIDKRWGDSVAGGLKAGMLPLVGAVAALRQFLVDPAWEPLRPKD